MNKANLIDSIAEQADLTKKQAADALDALTLTITDALSHSEDVSLIGFGTFKISERAARTGRNPKTGEAIQIRASKMPSFKAGKVLKEACNP
ncbi:transcriptional regulator [Aliivibrio fischeri]|uniref:Transcriptional regulator n=2 Tax=Aliivibrio fischeri TaxID=668 RepID=A0A510UNL8_ALIFS|nr:transcriptional regulator [Aliivibrio fischeri]